MFIPKKELTELLDALPCSLLGDVEDDVWTSSDADETLIFDYSRLDQAPLELISLERRPEKAGRSIVVPKNWTGD